LRIERAFVLTVGFAAVGVFCARLLAGDLPSGITTKGVEWVGEERIVAALQQAETSVDQLTAQSQAQDTAVATLRAELSDLQTHITGEVADTLENMRAAVGANAEAIGASNEGLASAHASIQNIMNVVQYLRNASEREAALNADNSTRITALEEASERLDARLVDLGDRLDEQLTDLRERITRMEQG
jgi:chromosome segregation ATPase